MSKPTAPIMRTHPLTGAPIEPIGRRPDGSPLWPILGGAPDDPPPGGPPPPPEGGKPPDPPKPPAGGPPTPPAGDKPDLTKLTAEQLRDHPSFQTELNRIITDRLKKEQEKWQEKLDEDKRRAGLDDAGKLQAQVEDEKKRSKAATAAVAAAHQLVASTRAEVLAIAEGGRADRAAAIVAQADLTGAIDDKGQVAEGVIRAAVLKVLDSYPEWKSNAPPPRSGTELPPAGGGGATMTRSQVEAMTAEERVERWDEIEKAMTDGKFVYDR